MAIIVKNTVIPSIPEARSRGHDIWELYLNGFASGGSDPEDGNTFYPQLGQQGLPTVYGIGIGPRSLVDRAWVLWDPQTVVAPGDPNEGTGPNFIREVSTRHPLLFSQTGNSGVGSLDPIGAIRIAGQAQDFTLGAFDLFQTDSDSVRRPISFVTPAGVTDVIAWDDSSTFGGDLNWQPMIHLQFYLRPPIQVPYLRAPAVFMRDVVVTVAAAESRLFLVPIHGRRQVRIQLRPTAAAVTADFRVGGFSVTQRVTAGTLTTFDTLIPETTLASGSWVASAGADLVLNEPIFDWLTVYVTVPAQPATIRTKIWATD